MKADSKKKAKKYSREVDRSPMNDVEKMLAQQVLDYYRTGKKPPKNTTA